MDPIAHTLTGGALAAAGLRRATPLATAALLIGANAPDIDVLAFLGGDFASLAHRRGWTHGVLALVVLPFIVTGALLAYDRWRRRRNAAATPARAGPLLGLSAIAVLSHPTLDWLNNYGMRWLMPFDGRWFYGDALFIIDPWVWLALGGVLFLMQSDRFGWLVAWTAFAVLGSVLVLTTPLPTAARVLWITGVAALATARIAGVSVQTHRRVLERAAAAALVLVALYSGAALIANVPARAEVRAALETAGVRDVASVMLGPMPADPFAAEVVAETPEAYYTGQWHWLRTPRFTLSPEAVPKRDAGPIAEAARSTRELRRYLAWSRYPYYEIDADGAGYTVQVGDVRYRENGRLAGVTIRLNERLEVVHVGE